MVALKKSFSTYKNNGKIVAKVPKEKIKALYKIAGLVINEGYKPIPGLVNNQLSQKEINWMIKFGIHCDTLIPV